MNSVKKKFNHRIKMAILKINGKNYALYEGINTIGRCITATVPLKHVDISKQHALIAIVNEDQHYVTDFQSFNGTTMNSSRLQPLVMYKLLDGQSIEFANVTAVYNKVPVVSSQIDEHDTTASTTQNSQFMTQSFYNGATQAIENDTSTSHEAPENENLQNFFDDDYNFADVSTQPPPPVLPTEPLKPLSIHEMPTQLFSEDVCESPVVANENANIHQQPTQKGKAINLEGKEPGVCMDIHTIDTQIVENSPIHNLPTQLTRNEDLDKDISDIEALDGSSIHNLPTQLVRNSKNQDTLDSTAIIDETIIDFEVEEGGSKTESQSQLQVNQLHRRRTRPIEDSETSEKENSESEEVINFKAKKVKIIESDSETDVEEEISNSKSNMSNILDNEVLQNTNTNSDTEAEITCENDFKAKVGSDSETDAEDFMVNAEVNNKTEDQLSYQVQETPGKSCLVEKESAVIDSDSDMDDFEFNTQADNSNMNEDSDDDYIIPATQCDENPILPNENLGSVTTEEKVEAYVHKLASTVEMEPLYLEPTQALLNDSDLHNAGESTNEAKADANDSQAGCNVSATDDDIFIRPTQPVLELPLTQTADRGAIFVPATELDSEDIFMQATQSIPNILKDDDAVFLKPSTPKKIGKNDTVLDSQSDTIFMQPTQPIVEVEMSDIHADFNHSNSATKKEKVIELPLDDIFVQPTQPISVLPTEKDSNMDHRDPDEIFLKPTQLIQSTLQDDVFEQPTQLVSVSALSNTQPQKDYIEDQLKTMFASQKTEKLIQIESQLEVVFDSQNVSVEIDNSRPSNPLVSEFEGKVKYEFTTTTSKIDKSEEKTKVEEVAESRQDKKVKDSIELLDQLSVRVHENKEKEVCDSETSSPNHSEAYSTKDRILKSNVVDDHIVPITSSKEFGNLKKEKRTRGSTADSKLPDGSSASPLNKDIVTSTSLKVAKRKPVNKELEFEHPKNKRKCIESDEKNVAIFNLPLKRTSKRSTRGQNNLNNETTEEASKATNNKTSMSKRVSKHTKSLEQKEDCNTSTNCHVELQPIILTSLENTKQVIRRLESTATEKKPESRTRTELSNDVEEVSRPKRHTRAPKRFKETETSVVISSDVKKTRRTRNQGKGSDSGNTSIETSDSESTAAVTETSTRAKGKKVKSEISSTSDSEGQKSTLVTKGKKMVSLSGKKQKSTDSDNDDFVPKTPGCGKKLNSTMLENTPDRNKRVLKPKVVFTMLENPNLESTIRSLGGRIVDSVEACTVLVTGSLKRSQKLLTAVGQSKPICSPDWIKECKKANKFLDPWDYILKDVEAEGKWKLSLKESLNRSQNHRLLEGYVVFIMVTSAIDVLKGAVESCGGKCVLKAPPKSTNNLIIVANAENKLKYSKFLKQTPPAKVVLPEAIFDGVLRQELHWEDHLLK